jgi:hypothetical protein
MIVNARAKTCLIQVKWTYLWVEFNCVLGAGLFHYRDPMLAKDNL